MEKLIATTARMRQINRELILDALKESGGAKISQLARMTNLSLATCANIIKSLLESGDAVEKAVKESNGGRPARVFLYNARDTTIVCLLLKRLADRAEMSYTINDVSGKIISKGGKSVRDLTLEDLDALLAALKRDFAVKLAVIALPGVITNGVVTECDIPALAGVALKRRIRDRHDLNLLADNDLNYAAVAYHRSSTDAPVSGLAFLAFPANRCPGCGLVLNNLLVRGRSDFAGEIATLLPLLKAADAHPGRARIVEMAGTFSAIVIALVNPDVVVIAGDGVRPDMLTPITRACLKVIPERHMPRIIIRTDYESDCFAGMLSMAANYFSCSYKLLETGKLWCGSGNG